MVFGNGFPLRRFHSESMKSLCVFCGSNEGGHPEFAAVSRQLGIHMVQQGWGLVYGGGNIGLMGILANTVLQEGGRAVGIIPGHLADKELLHTGLTETHIVSTMHERKALMERLSNAFMALPGGFGTLEEFCEMLTWAQLELHQKPCGLLNHLGFFDQLLAFMDHQVNQGFVTQVNRRLVLTASEPESLLHQLENRLASPA